MNLARDTDSAAMLARLGTIIAARTVGNEDRESGIPNLSFYRRENRTEPCACLVEPSLVLVVQGSKQMLVGDQHYPYNAEHFLLTAIDLPASSQVLEASQDTPCLGMVLRLDLSIMNELIAQGGLCPPPERPAGGQCMAQGKVTPSLLDAFCRLLALLDQPQHLAVLGPLIQREIHYRLLVSEQASRLWHILSAGSNSQRIARAIDWLKTHYTEPLTIDELASRAQMSPSSLHHHFRQLTAMSPLQYVKWLRLNEARRLMLNDGLEAATAAFRVGYESPSQFSREYGRLFGLPPKRDISQMTRQSA
ncbi:MULTISPECIES: AraC family transcriptional regulator [unclassified Paludibacterium]|uniref:AraC family transcriptional regulator n=1 Tax=unclassified Paludibacterium TaxID=2618429 RepID=UPI001C05676C|nr:AraC family transcriptional regulator [Paludibacterium sp. B53371]BEV72639.1 AraC family transcriptional regulator [Paludibacterium sp. THUN1379]